jgi:hypothetical protein
MRKILTIAFALMLALVLLLPTMGYSIKTGNHSYSINSVRQNYSIGIEAPSHEPAVVVSRVPNSLKYGALYQPEAKGVGETAKGISLGRSASSDMGIPKLTKTPNVSNKKLSLFIHGIVFDDQNGNGTMDGGEAGIAGMTVSLEQMAGNKTSMSVTNASGRYGFDNLLPGDYVVTEVPSPGWSITTPSSGRYPINLTGNITSGDFGNEMIPEPVQNTQNAQNTTAISNAALPDNSTSPENSTMPKSA